MAYRNISDLEQVPSDCRHAAHCMIYTRLNKKLFGLYSVTSAVLMQMRFDGTIGFVGGFVDKGESPEEACTRECCEELGATPSILNVTKENHLFTRYSDRTKYCLHFYGKEVPYTVFAELETKTLKSKEWGEEVLGIIRCPTYTLPNGLGFPAFLRNEFIGNARDQLIMGLERVGLLTREEINKAIKISEKVNSVVTVKNSIYDENMQNTISE